MGIYLQNSSEKVEIKKLYVQNNSLKSQIGKIYNSSKQIIYTAAPPFLYLNGAMDQEYLKSFETPKETQDDAHSGNATLSLAPNIVLSMSQSSGYGETFTGDCYTLSNFMDLSGCDSLYFEWKTKSGVAYQGGCTSYLSLRDIQGREMELFQSYVNDNGESSYSKTSIINNLNIDLSNCCLKIRTRFTHHAPWQNWYGGSGETIITKILCN